MVFISRLLDGMQSVCRLVAVLARKRAACRDLADQYRQVGDLLVVEDSIVIDHHRGVNYQWLVEFVAGWEFCGARGPIRTTRNSPHLEMSFVVNLFNLNVTS
jgi:hypothetical protein